jgi:hypothetical protein
MINLHAIVNPIIAILHPNESIILYIAAGQVNEHGMVRPLFAAPLKAEAQIQSLTSQDLQNDAGMPKNEIGYKAYIFSAPDDKDKPASIIRAHERGGDIVRRADGTWWKATAMPEDFSKSGWVCLTLTEQIKAPDFSANDWWDGEN